MDINSLYKKIDKQGLQELILICKENSGINESILEKDLYLTSLLKKILEMSPEKEHIYFKGGTSIAKCHHIIDRFSEDIDLFVYSGDKDASKKKEDKLNGKVTHVLIDNYPSDILPGGKRGGDYNKILLSYNISFPNFDFKPHVEFEISSCALQDKSRYAVSSSILTVQPIIGEILAKIGRQDLSRELGLEPFPVQCLSPEKALCDKISRMIRVSYAENPTKELCGYIRDAYDIAMFMSNPRFPKFLQSEQFLEKMYVTNLEDRLRTNSHAMESYSYAPMFVAPKKIMQIPEVIFAYEQMINSFIFNPEKAPSLEQVISSFEAMHPAMQRFDAYRKEQDNGTGGAGGSGIIIDGHIVNGEEENNNDQISESDKEGLESLGVSPEQIRDLQKNGDLTIGSHNYRPAKEWDKDIPQEKSTMNFSFHDGQVFVLAAGTSQEYPLRNVLRGAEALSRFTEKNNIGKAIEDTIHKGLHK